MTGHTHTLNFAARMGRWSATHRRRAVLAWIAFVVVAFALGTMAGTKKIGSNDGGNGESQRAQTILEQAGFEQSAGESVLVQSRDGAVRASDPTFRAAVADVARRVAAVPVVKSIRTPIGNPRQLSADGRAALVQFEIRGDADKAHDKIQPVLDAVAAAQKANPALRIEEFGDASADKALNDTVGEDFKRAEYLSIPVTLAILLVAFGALVAAGIPLLLGLTSVFAALGLLALVSHVVAADDSANSVILLIGLAVGVDYSLFYLKREREERAAGAGPEAALQAAAATSGRSVLISGLTVIAALAGMFLTANSVFTSIAIGTILVVAISVAGSLTVLPAVLSKLGDRVDRGRVPFVSRRRPAEGGAGGFWGAIVGAVLRRPVASVVVAGGLLVALAVPAFSLHTSLPGLSGLPRSLAIMKTYDHIQQEFPGGPVPADVVVRAANVDAPAVRDGIASMTKAALATRQMRNPVHVEVSKDRTVASVSIPLVGKGTDSASNHALATLRGKVIPATIERVPGVTADVTGMTAGSVDFNRQMKSRAPYVFVFVLALAFVLLLAAFRSVVIGATAIVLNLLSVGAAYGLLALVFQHHWAEDILGFKSTGGITAWLPLFLFVVLFGLSMDYHVFILSRIREAFDRGLKTEDAVAHGVKTTAGVISSAAIVMVAVFAIFATLSQLEMKQLGVGLAAAVLIDATLVRAVLLPAMMKLLGRANWWFPSWLEWLPRIGAEGRAPAPAAAAAALGAAGK